MSRLKVSRELPRARAALARLGALELLAYNIVGDGTPQVTQSERKGKREEKEGQREEKRRKKRDQ